MKKTSLFKRALLPTFILLFVCTFHSVQTIAEEKEHSTEITQNFNDEYFELIIKQDLVKQELLTETKQYILNSVPKAKLNVDNIVEHLVNQSLGNNVDLCFVLAQCKIETAFGTAGMGRSQSKKSMFGINRTYHTYQDCISHYMKNLKKNYLSDERTVHDLMNKYVTHNGHRYASDPRYEKTLKNQYHEIKNKTKIDNLEKEYLELNILLEKYKLEKCENG